MAAQRGDEDRSHVTLYVPEGLHRQLKVHVAETGGTLNALATVLFRNYLEATATEQAEVIAAMRELTDQRRRRSNPEG